MELNGTSTEQCKPRIFLKDEKINSENVDKKRFT
jgi:hypothetical protein